MKPPASGRVAASLIETLVVLAIMGTMVGLLLPAVQRVRGRALRTQCENNLRQIGLAVHTSYDSGGELPHARLCPAPWKGGKDPYCQTVPTPDFYTGPGERWWVPYDNRPGSGPTRALPGYMPDGALWEFVGKDRRLFVCPEGIDRTPGSPTRGEAFQISYALNPAAGGRKLTDPLLPSPLVWEHDDFPVCASVAAHGTAWPASPPDRAQRHRPGRHAGVMNALFKDGHVSASTIR